MSHNRGEAPPYRGAARLIVRVNDDYSDIQNQRSGIRGDVGGHSGAYDRASGWLDQLHPSELSHQAFTGEILAVLNALGLPFPHPGSSGTASTSVAARNCAAPEGRRPDRVSGVQPRSCRGLEQSFPNVAALTRARDRLTGERLHASTR